MKKNGWVVYFGLLLLAYVTPFFFHFAHHDQYRHFRIPDTEKLTCDNDTQYRGLFYDLGRPVTAWMECYQFMTTNTVADLNWHRFLTVAVIAGLFFLLVYGFQTRLGLEKEPAYCLALSICVLPGLLNLFIMSNYAVVFGVFAAAAAFALLNFELIGMVAAFLLICVSLFTYPPSAFVFLALAFAEFIYSRRKLAESWRNLWMQFALVVAGVVIFLVVVKLVLHPVVSYDERDVRGSYSFRLSTDIWFRAVYHATTFRKAFNFWNIYSNWFIASGAMAAVIWLAVRLTQTKGHKKDFKYKLIAGFVAPLIVFSPIGLSSMDEVLYRTMIGFSTALILFVYWLLRMNFRIPKWSYLAFAALVTLVSGFNLGMAAWNSSMEFKHLVDQIKSRGLLNSRILFMKNVERPDSTLGMNGLPTVSDEFNINTTTYNREENTFIMRAALVEAGGDPRIHVYLCVTPEDCGRAEQIIQTMPFVYVVVKQNDTTGFPPRYPIIDMEQFSR